MTAKKLTEFVPTCQLLLVVCLIGVFAFLRSAPIGKTGYEPEASIACAKQITRAFSPIPIRDTLAANPEMRAATSSPKAPRTPNIQHLILFSESPYSIARGHSAAKDSDPDRGVEQPFYLPALAEPRTANPVVTDWVEPQSVAVFNPTTRSPPA